MERILFLINTGAGTGMPGNLQQEIDRLSEIHHFRHRVTELGGQAEVSLKIRKELDIFNPTIAVAAGGDGTVNLVAAAIMDRKIRLAILPLGSSNGMAYQLGIPDDPGEALKVLVEGKVQKVDLLEINGERICLHMADLGMNARVIRRYEDTGMRGFLGYARQYFRELGNLRRFRFTAETGREKLRSKAVMIVMANASYYGTGASITPDGRTDDGWFELVVVQAYPYWFLFYMTISILMRNFNHNRFHRIVRCRKTEIQLDPPQELQIDGEPMGKTAQLQVEIHPGRLQMVVPAST